MKKFFFLILILVIAFSKGEDARMRRFMDKQLTSYQKNRAALDISPESFKLTVTSPHNYSCIALFGLEQFESVNKVFVQVLEDYLEYIHWDYSSPEFRANPLFFSELNAYTTVSFWKGWGYDPPFALLIKPSAEKQNFDHRSLTLFKIKDMDGASDLREFIRAELGFEIPARPDYGKFLIALAVVILLAIIFLSDTLQGLLWNVWTTSFLWFLLSAFIYAYSISGQVYNSINTPPWQTMGQDGEPMWIYPSLRQQFGAEGFIMAALFSSLGFIQILMIKFLDTDSEWRRRLIGYIGLGAMAVGLIMAQNIFNMKMGM